MNRLIRKLLPPALGAVIGLAGLTAASATAEAAASPAAGGCAGTAVVGIGLPSGAVPRLAGAPAGTSVQRAGGSAGLCGPSRFAAEALPVTVAGSTYYPSLGGGPALAERIVHLAGRAGSLPVSYEDVGPLSTRVVPASDVRVLSSTGARSTLQLSAAASAGLRPGGIVVALSASGRGLALVGRIVDVRLGRNGALVATRSASPLLAFSRMRLQWRGPLSRTIEALSVGATAGRGVGLGVGVRASSDSASPSASCSGGASLSLNGSVSFSPTASFSLGWTWVWDWITYVPEVSGSVSVSPGASASLTLSANGAVTCGASVGLPSIDLGSICTEFGCITLQLGGSADLSGTASETMSETATESLGGSVGANFNFGATGSGFSPFDSLSLSGSTRSTSEWFGSASASIDPTLSVLYGIPGVGGVGPTVGMSANLTFNGNPSGWNLTAGTSASVGVALDVDIPYTSWGFNWSDSYSWPLGTWTLASGSWISYPTYYSGYWGNQLTSLSGHSNVTVEGLSDARQVGSISDFQTNNSSFSCLNGASLNVWTAPKEFPGEYVVHNGGQGPQCTYGTWTFPIG